MPIPRPFQTKGVTRHWPVRLILIGIVFALVLPGLVFCGVLLSRIAGAERTRSQDAALAGAMRGAEALDRELGNLNAALLALSTSPAIDARDFAGFQRQAEAVAASIGQAVVLSDLSGQQIVNSRRPFGAVLPHMGSVATVRQVVERRRPAVSNLFSGAMARQLLIAVEVPVIRDGVVAYVLAMSIEPSFISALLAKQGLPAGWLTSVVDGTGRIVGRAPDGDRFVGTAVLKEQLDHMQGDHETWIGSAIDGTQVLAATQRLRLADWHVGVGVPVSMIEAPLRSTLMLLAVTGAATLAIAILLAWTLASSVASPLQRLARAGTAMSRGVPITGVRSPIAEVDAVSRALVQATRDLEQQVAARTAELEQANQRLRDEAQAREAAEEQLRQAQKMEAVGQLTGGIAHDFNNLLTIVIGSLDLLRRKAGDDRTRRLLDNAMDGAARAATLTARLLAFSRRQPLMPQRVDVNRLVGGMSDLLRRTLGEAIQIETILAGGLWPAHVDPNQLENALLNLAVNARDAIRATDADTGQLVIETANTVLDAADLAGDRDVPPGEYVRMAVTDTGTGMPPATLARVFEPFFTTKPQGQGTGLGLSQVHGFIKQSGGHVAIRTAPGAGTTVTLYLPRLESEAAIEAPQDRLPEAASGTIVVLLVEDDAGVRHYSAEALRELGHVVLEADGGPSALRLLDTHPEITLLLTDVLLPGIDGVRLAAEAQRRRHGLPVLFASGYTAQETQGSGTLPDGAVLLQKPYDLHALAGKLREALDGDAPVRPAGLEPATKPL